LASAALAQDRGAAFTPVERARLLAGELVRRPDARREGSGRYIGGTSWQRVHAPREAVWRVVNDVSNYPRLIPGVDRAEVVEDRGAERVVLLRHSYSFVSASYSARVRVDEDAYTITFELDPSRPHDISDGRGFITPYRYGADETIVTWGVRADVGSGIHTGVFAPVIHDWILRGPWCGRGRMEPGHGSC
jgi:carbon monoxide dehydrogenase subunit G